MRTRDRIEIAFIDLNAGVRHPEREPGKGKMGLDKPARERSAQFYSRSVDGNPKGSAFNLSRCGNNWSFVQLYPKRQERAKICNNYVAWYVILGQRPTAKAVAAIAVFRSRRERIVSIVRRKLARTTAA